MSLATYLLFPKVLSFATDCIYIYIYILGPAYFYRVTSSSLVRTAFLSSYCRSGPGESFQIPFGLEQGGVLSVYVVST